MTPLSNQHHRSICGGRISDALAPEHQNHSTGRAIGSLSPARQTAAGAGEAEAKAALLNLLRGRRTIRQGTTVISELGLGGYKNRADLVIVNDRTHCFEVKTKLDTLARLDRQIEAYSATFDLVSVVAAARHMNAVISRVPTWVGLYEIHDRTGGPVVKSIRVAQISPVRTKLSLIRSLPLFALRQSVGKGEASWRRAEYETAAETLAARLLRLHFANFLRQRFQQTSAEMMQGAVGRPINAVDVKRLSIWRPLRARLNSTVEQNTTSEQFDWETYCHMAASFGPVPDDVVNKLSRVSQSTLPRWGPSPRQSALADVSDC